MGNVSSSIEDDEEDPQCEFNKAIEEFHIARAEGRVVQMLIWYSTLLANCEEVASTAEEDLVDTTVRRELLLELKRVASQEATKQLAHLAKVRKSHSSKLPSNKATEKEAKAAKDKVKEEARRIKGMVEKLGLVLDKSSTSQPSEQAHVCKRQTALVALNDALTKSAATLDVPSSEEFGAELAACFDRCIALGAGSDAVAAYGSGLQRALDKTMAAATDPLLARAATKRHLGKMLQRSSESEGPKLGVEVDDSDDPRPHFTAFTKVLSAASVVLGDMHATAQRLLSSSEGADLTETLKALLSEIATAASLKAKRVSDLFSEECGLEQSHAMATDWLSRLEAKGRGVSTGDDGGGPAAVKSPDLLELDVLLEDLCDLLSVIHRFFGFLRQVLGFSLSELSDLPLFVDSLTLATLYVDLEATYFLSSTHRSLDFTSLIEIQSNVHVSSISEDVFFILRDKTLERCTATLSEQATLAVCARVVQALEASAAEPSLYMALSNLPDATQPAHEYETLKKSAADAHRKHRQRLRGDRKAQVKESGQDTEQGGGESESLQDLVESLRAAADDDAAMAVDEEALIKLVVATNSADVSEAATRRLAEAMVAGGTSDAIILKLSQTSVADLDRVAGAYSDLREHFTHQLMSVLEAPLAALGRALAKRTFHVGRNAAPLPGPAVVAKAEELDAPKGEEPMRRRDRLMGVVTSAGGHLLGTRAAAASPLSEGSATPTDTTSLSQLCQSHVFDGYVFFTLQQRLTPTALAHLLQLLAKHVAAAIAGLFLRRAEARKVSEWGAFALQREVRDLEQLIEDLNLYGHSSFAEAFAILDQSVSLLTLDRPSDVILYTFREEVMPADDIRNVLHCRFSDHLVNPLRLPWEIAHKSPDCGKQLSDEEA